MSQDAGRGPLRAACLAGLCAYFAALVIMAPASLLDGLAQRASSGRLGMAGAQGTLWSGQGELQLLDTRGGAELAQLTWQLMPLWLLRGRLAFHVRQEQYVQGQPGGFMLTLSASGLDIDDATLELPTAVLAQAIPRLAPLQLSGTVSLHAQDVHVAAGGGPLPQFQGQLTAQWRAAGSALAPVSPFGSYQLALQNNAGAMMAEVSTLQGPIHLDGRGSWPAGAAPVLPISISVPPLYQDAFTPLLQLISVQQADGRFQLQLN